jgi:formylglycine-generating enzyme required for sulfatase activity/Tfp pilus assembly protein PilF
MLEWSRQAHQQQEGGSMAQVRIFVSHSSTDKPFVDALVHALREAGADVWYDEHNLGTGQLLDEIQRELRIRPVFVVILSKAAFASPWVREECRWAWTLGLDDPTRIILPVVALAIDRSDFDGMLFLTGFKRIEGPGNKPYPQAEAIERTLLQLGLYPAGSPQRGQEVVGLIARGKALIAQKQQEQAILLFQAATVMGPGSADAWLNLAEALHVVARYAEALKAWDRVLGLDPNSALAWNGKGATLLSLKLYQEALDALDRALALDRSLVSAWSNKGLAQRGLWHPRLASDAFERALELDPDNVDILVNEGAAFSELNWYWRALEVYERALALDPRNVAARKGAEQQRQALGLAHDSVLPESAPVHPAPPSTPRGSFPIRLANLGYEQRSGPGVDVVIPPLCDVPAGEFLMGSDPTHDKELYNEEEPQCSVSIPTFQIARYLVTVAEYTCFVRIGRREPQAPSSSPTWQQQLGKPDHPVVNVSWRDAMAYAAWLMRMTGEQWRLPTEAEWEKAARWDPAIREARIYPWGDAFDRTRCNTSEDKLHDTTPVGAYPLGMSPCGAMDMAGTVWEWTSSSFRPYPYSADDGREPPYLYSADDRKELTETPGKRVARGGAYIAIPRYARTAYRLDLDPDVVYGFVGFRLVRSVPGT